MKRGRLPLTALRSFEVAGRLQSFTLAAEELHISQAAISRQVRELESRLGQMLFERHHRSVSLTLAGKTLLATLTKAFDDIAASLDAMDGSYRSSTLRVSVEPSFASAWLVRNMASFQKVRPDIDIVLDTDCRLVEFRTGQAVIAIRHSAAKTEWPRVDSRQLTPSNMVPVVAPHLMATPCQDPSELLKFPLLHEENRDLWQNWFAAAGVRENIQKGTVYTDGGLVLQAALQGEGIALMDDFFVRHDLGVGRLIQPFEHSIPHGAYWLVARNLDHLPDAAAAFVQWIVKRLEGVEAANEC
ncbi:LysR substrate-binding domain-containing protein [Rhizobium sp. AG855]|uniref:LysR substrate-binding domain-containing protein n=1 Tax=Rhizobium sp. AG855 TaxID=2183898 RepID=UPI000E76F916|nr:LysR substrate-binding domain-containing protein [Rhizobium sp. AG855]RKE83574.1 LysR family glycine cleavage system transcriptional activator [Rhizobium sp. AG855]